MATNLVGTKYKDMTPEYQAKYSKEEYKAQRESQRMAGDAIGAADGNKEAAIQSSYGYGVSNLDDFDTRSTGSAGSLGKGYEAGPPVQYGGGKDKFSNADLYGLYNSADGWYQDSGLVGGDEGYLPEDLAIKQAIINESAERVAAGSAQGDLAATTIADWQRDIDKYVWDGGGGGTPGPGGGGPGPGGGGTPGPGGGGTPGPGGGGTPGPGGGETQPPISIISNPVQNTSDVTGNGTSVAVQQVLNQIANAEINMGDYNNENAFSGNTFGDGGSINVQQNQTAGNATATNTGSNNSTVTVNNGNFGNYSDPVAAYIAENMYNKYGAYYGRF